MKFLCRTVWISDTHLGSRGARAAELSQFLKRIRCKQLYLVGDIIDMESLRQRWYWPPEHNEVIRRLLKMAQKGVEIIYIPGNHDAAARQYMFLSFGGMRLCPHAIHELADGRKLLVTHGDEYDLIVMNSPWLACLGTWTYDWLLLFNRLFNGARSMVGLPYYSLSKRIKQKVKSACQFMSRYEETLRGTAKRMGLAGVVCGHIHKAESHVTDGIAYFNCGDWVEGTTALIEHDDGRMEIVDATALLAELQAADAARAVIASVEKTVPELLTTNFGRGPAPSSATDWSRTDSDGDEELLDEAMAAVVGK